MSTCDKDMLALHQAMGARTRQELNFFLNFPALLRSNYGKFFLVNMAASNHGFSASALDKKLKGLNSTLQSIQGTSQWLIHYRKNAKTIVGQWYKELQNGEVKVHIMTWWMMEYIMLQLNATRS